MPSSRKLPTTMIVREVRQDPVSVRYYRSWEVQAALGAAFSDTARRSASRLMVIPWNRRPTFANQEIEIHTLICLQDVVVKKSVPASGRRLRCFPSPLSPGQFFIGNFQVQSTLWDIQLYHIARLH
jgi:hypothetical protein